MKLMMVVFSLFGLTNLVFAGGHDGVIDISKTDILERLINFVIFVLLLWYLVADKLKNILSSRSRDIANKLSESQSKIKESRSKKEQAQLRLKEANQKAKEIIEVAKKEALLSKREIEEKTKEQIAYLIKNNEESMQVQARLLQKEIIQEVLEEIFSSQKISLTSNDYIKILEKKVA
ncbi:hypothetical protein CQA66_00195 [Helicobacter aurati]|uniref:ATP synthase subunit b n=1 Tax=Helicobacter aurati TaxID=137778 RepID=A0A3D8J8S4_9HELI|nr:hypothetical protein [Helicobacter aurati]RDU73828.1 hypothetical protein CQA66_00195 [Helicobacter aurati]